MPTAPLASGSAASKRESLASLELARELCETLHELPATRKAACCGGATELGLAEICRVEVGAALTRGAQIDRERLSACRSAMLRATSGCDWVVPWSQATPKECEGVLSGGRAEGEPCGSSLECREPLHCDRASIHGLGKCRAPGEIGEACGASVDALATYTRQGPSERKHPTCRERCIFSEHRCGEAPKVGSACYSSANCGQAQRCIEGQCVVASAGQEGESCKAGCADGLRCVKERCLPQARAGESCESDLDCSAGGCVEQPDGARRCGMKCRASLAALRSSATPTLQLPLRPRDQH